jgi:predicted helicase
MVKTAEDTKGLLAYIADLNKRYNKGNATEHTYRPALQRLLESLTSGLSVTNEPRRTDCGAPDYIVTKNDIPIGYVEAKDIGIDLNAKAHREQFTRYKKSLNNLIITDYIRFLLFVDGEPVTSATIGLLDNDGIEADKSQFEAFAALIDKFTGYKGQTIHSSEQLSKIMAVKAQFLANTIYEALSNDPKDKNGNAAQNTLRGQLEGLQRILIHDLAERTFSDIYAQTIAYGLFAARLNSNPSSVFTRGTAAQFIKPSNPFLRSFFQYIAGLDLDERIQWIVDDLADIFNAVDIAAINKEFCEAEHDPIIHFYETFLSEYDWDLRKERGVWYTPQPIVRFIVQAVDDILTQDFKLSKGLANASKIKMDKEKKEYHRVQILDPATGTGTFIAEVINNVYRRFENQAGMWQSYAADDLLPRIFGFEVLMAPYTIAHIKLDMALQKTGYKHPPKTRQQIYLTNSLEMSQEKSQMRLEFVEWLSNEANEATNIKQNVPVMVVLGNPPYSGESQNTGLHVSWLDDLMNDYKKEPGTEEKLNERNYKWLNDDYVKFIRYGQHFIEKSDGGVLAFINNHSFLDNPTFRGMRYNLLKTFDKIYVLDLHGNAKKKEAAPDGGKDTNVFDIQQGVSINLFVKSGHKAKNALAEVFHYDLYGERADKFKFLSDNNLKSVKWQKLEPREPLYFFVPKDFSFFEEYKNGFGVLELFAVNSVGIVTARDNFTIHNTAESLKNTINKFIRLDIETARKEFDLGKDVRDWSVAGAKSDLTSKPDFSKIVEINYRPFDTKFTYYTGHSKGFHCMPRENVMRHFLNGENVGLMVCRQQKTSGFYHCLVHCGLVESSFVSNNTSEIGSSFPLYLYPEPAFKAAGETRRPNLNEAIIGEISRLTKLRFTAEKESAEKTFAPIDVLDYIYGVLHSPAYRERYKEFLKIDFPRVPYPESAKDFRAWVAFGGKLRRLHLMEDVEPKDGIAEFPVRGSNEVENLKYADGKVFINGAQYFNRVPPEAWVFYIGGYQPAQKWLKDRKGQVLNHKDVEHYRKIVRVLLETEKLMRNK